MSSRTTGQHVYKYGMSTDVCNRLQNYAGCEWKMVEIIPTKHKHMSAVESELKRCAVGNGEYRTYINLEELILTTDIGKYVEFVKGMIEQ